MQRKRNDFFFLIYNSKPLLETIAKEKFKIVKEHYLMKSILLYLKI